eukprot:m.355862 g.355862  ORF g.355862 m.355862 type:complete len:175 (-) comp17361_c0_seq1:320-844(-)
MPLTLAHTHCVLLACFSTFHRKPATTTMAQRFAGLLASASRRLAVQPATRMASMQQVATLRLASTSATSDDRMIDPSYPHFTDVSAQTRRPEGYWNSQDRRNFGDTLDENDDVKTMWVVDETPVNGTLDDGDAVKQLLIMFGLLLGVGLFAKKVNQKDRRAVVDRETEPLAFEK